MPTYYRNPGGDAPEKKISLNKFSSPPKLFLAEGVAEASFLESLFCDRRYQPNEYAIFCFGGINKLKIVVKTLEMDPLFPDITTIGVMVDADNDPDGRLRSVLNHFRRIGFIGGNTTLEGLGIATYGQKQLGVFVSPGAGLPGRIEDLIIREIEQNAEYACVEKFFDCLTDVTGEDPSNKAIAQAFITSKKDDLCGVGRAFDNGIFDINHPAYRGPVDIFTNL